MSDCGREDHCCWLHGKVCKYLEENPTGSEFRYACALRRELGSWDKVHSDPRYLRDVKPELITISVSDCGRWPPVGQICNTCGVGRG